MVRVEIRRVARVSAIVFIAAGENNLSSQSFKYPTNDMNCRLNILKTILRVRSIGARFTFMYGKSSLAKTVANAFSAVFFDDR